MTPAAFGIRPFAFDAARGSPGTPWASDGLRAFSQQAFTNAGAAFDRVTRGAAVAQATPAGHGWGAAADAVGGALAAAFATPDGRSALEAAAARGTAWLRDVLGGVAGAAVSGGGAQIGASALGTEGSVAGSQLPLPFLP